jgi:hypothetical protein
MRTEKEYLEKHRHLYRKNVMGNISNPEGQINTSEKRNPTRQSRMDKSEKPENTGRGHSKHNTENYTFEVDRKWGSSIMKYPDRRGVAKTDKQNKHTFVDLNLVLCCTFSASMLKFQMLLTCMYSLWA